MNKEHHSLTTSSRRCREKKAPFIFPYDIDKEVMLEHTTWETSLCWHDNFPYAVFPSFATFKAEFLATLMNELYFLSWRRVLFAQSSL